MFDFQFCRVESTPQSNPASTFDRNPLLHDNANKTKTEKIAVDRSTFEEIGNAFPTSIRRSIKQAPTTAATQQRTNQSLMPWKRFRQALQTSKESTRNSIQIQLCKDHQKHVIQIPDNAFGIPCETYNASGRQQGITDYGKSTEILKIGFCQTFMKRSK